MRFQFLFKKQWIVTRLSDPERKRISNFGAWDSECPMAKFLKSKPRNNAVTTKSRPKTLSTGGWANRMAQFHQGFRRSTNSAVMEVSWLEASGARRGWQLICCWTWGCSGPAERPSSTWTEACREDRIIGMRPEQKTVVVVDSTRNEGVD